jgi:adenylate cyclase
VPLVVLLNNRFFPSINLQIILDYFNVEPGNLIINLGHEIVLKKTIHIPIDDRGRMFINYAGKWSDTFKHYSFIDILKNSDDPELREILEDNICLISLTATGATDIGLTPLETDFPLSGVHSNIINTVLTQNFLKEASFLTNLLIFLFLSFVIAVVSIFLSPFMFVITALGVISGYGLTAFIFFNKYGIILTLVLPVGAGIVSLFSITVFRFIAGDRERKKLELAFKSYFSPQMLKMIVDDPKILSLSGRRKELTVLFSDIAGFSTLSEKIAPEEIQILLNEYFDEMTNIVFKYDGTVDKFMGDGMLAFFGDPIPNDGHALSAVRSAIDMQKKVKELQKKWANEGRYPFEIRIGINTGWVTVGNMGSKRRMEYTVLGEEVNLAQRLESNAKPGKILIGNRTYSLVKEKM